MKKYDVVIIGGGLSGLVAANVLSKGSKDVLLIEKSKSIGGRGQTNKFKNDFFNIGPHAFYKRGEAKEVMDELGIELKGGTPKPGGQLMLAEKIYEAPFSLKGIFTTKLLNFNERLEWLRVILSVRKAVVKDLEELSFYEWVHASTNYKKVQQLLLTLGRLATYCDAPKDVSAIVMVGHLKAVLDGVIYLDGGWQKMIDQLQNKAVLQGVIVKSNAVVRKIQKVKNEFNIKIETEEIIADQVLYTGSPRSIGEIFSDINMTFYEEMIPIKAGTLDVALSKLPNPNNLFTMGMTEDFYFSVHSEYCKLSKDNHIILHVLKYHKLGEKVIGSLIKEELEAFLEKVQPGWQKYIVSSRCLPNITVNQRLPKIGELDPFNRQETEVPNFYVAGDWASSTSLLSEAAIVSGKKAAEEIMLKW